MKFINYISEAVIKVDLPSFRHRVEKVFTAHPTNRKNLIKALNDEFRSDVITFTVDPKQKTDIDGFMYRDNREIEISIRSGFLKNKNNELIDKILEVMKHELVHRQQITNYMAAGRFYLKDNPPEGEEVTDFISQDRYLSNKDETMAFAAQIVATLRHEGYKDSQIIDMLRHPDKWDEAVQKSRSHLESYYMFAPNSKPFKRLAKYIVQYITGEQK